MKFWWHRLASRGPSWRWWRRPGGGGAPGSAGTQCRTGGWAGKADLLAIIERLELGVVLVDAAGQGRACNARAAEMFGLPVDQIRELIGPADPDGDVSSLPYRHNGRSFRIDTITLPGGRQARIIADVTAGRGDRPVPRAADDSGSWMISKGESIGRELAGQLAPGGLERRGTVHETNDWIWETDTQLRWTFVSKRFGDTSGVPWEALQGGGLDGLVALGVDPAGMEELQQTIRERNIFHAAVHRVLLGNGQTRYWQLSGVPFFDPGTGAFAGYRGFGTDVTARIDRQAALEAALLRAEQAEHEARQATARLADGIEAVPEGFVLADAADRLVLCNSTFRDMYRLPAELTVPGAPFEDLLRRRAVLTDLQSSGLTAEQWVAARMRSHRMATGDRTEEHLVDGRWIQINERRTSDGGTVGIRVDVTEARQRALLERERERNTAELKAARSMQGALLPSRLLQRQVGAQAGLDIAGCCASSSELGGDLWGLSALDDRQVGGYIVDFSGHGVTAALNTFRLHTLMHELRSLSLDPAHLLVELNARLVALLPIGNFATMFYGVIDPDRDAITYACAGSPAPIIRGSGCCWSLLDSSGLPLGVTPDANYENRAARFGPGGVLLLYSDLLTDVRNARGHRAGDAAVLELIPGAMDEASAEAVVERICAPFLDQPETLLTDDLTTICIKR